MMHFPAKQVMVIHIVQVDYYYRRFVVVVVCCCCEDDESRCTTHRQRCRRE